MALIHRLLLRFVILLLPFLFCCETSNVESYLQYRSVSTSVCLRRSQEQCGGWWTARTCQNVYYCEYQQRYNAQSYVAYRCKSGWKTYPDCNVPICNPSCESGFKCVRPNVCEDINECATNNHSCQQICINTAGTYKCSCRSGYELQTNERNCVDINECVSDAHGCEHNCINTDGGFECRCRIGYTLHANGKSCNDIDECATNTHSCQHICINTPGTYKCGCRRGYELQANGRNCADIDECTSGTHGCKHYCVNNDGSFKCHCIPGYTLHEDEKSCNATCIPSCREGFQCIIPDQCADIDECALNSPSCQHRCLNTQGSYRCQCSRGYDLQPDKRTCIDIDECASDTHDCKDQCINNDGSFECRCTPGYTLHEDDKSCNDIDECATNVHLCDQICYNRPGTYSCGCRNGYNLQPDGTTCRDINECASKTHGCRHYCINNDGSFTCHCVPGYTLHEDGKSCNATCDPSCGAGFRCTSPDLCTDVDECAKNSHLCHHVCQNTIGSYKCGCRGGHELQSDERTCRENRLLLEAEESNEVETDA